MTVGSIKLAQNVEATVKADIRAATARNHSATHLLHAALRQILGEHVQQKGSLVASDILRFDFANDQPVSFEQLQEIERLVNAEVIANTAVSTELLDIESAKAKGAMMLFGENMVMKFVYFQWVQSLKRRTSQSSYAVVFTLNAQAILACSKSLLKVV